eukprot:325732_1
MDGSDDEHMLTTDLEINNDLEMEDNVPYSQMDSVINEEDQDDFAVNSTNYPSQNQNSYFEPFVGTTSPTSLHGDQKQSKNEECMRKILQLTFIICIVFFISPLIFFIAGASQIVPEYASISPAVRKDPYDTSVKDIWHYPSMHQICAEGKHHCIRYVFFLVYVIIFTIMYVCCISLFAIRKEKHPLKSRSCVFITIFCISLPLFMIWACIGLLYAPGWLGCYTTHNFNNIAYPMLILPYFFRAYRIKKIYDEATTTHNNYQRDMNIFRSARATSILSTHIVEQTKSKGSMAQTGQSMRSGSHLGTHKIRSDSVLSQQGNDDSYSFNFDDALAYSKALDKRLIKHFLISLLPFLLMSILNYFIGHRGHLLPTFIKSCDDDYKSSAIFIWVMIHVIEIFILILIVYWIRLVWRAFSVKQELMIVAVIDMVFCACMIGFNPSDDLVDDGVLILYLILMRGIGFFMITILLPLYKTYFLITYLPEIPTQDVITSLRAILDDMDACGFFRTFMSEQDSQYLLDFWMEVDLFKDACYNDEIEDIRFSASKIFKKYFDSDNDSRAAMGIQFLIDSKEKKKGERQSKKKTFCKAINKIFDEKHRGRVEIHPNIFDHPHRVVFDHMESTHYRLFLRSQFCKELLASVAGQEEIFRKLINQEVL